MNSTKSNLHLFITLLWLSFQNLGAQPLATPEQLGMEQQYFIRAGLGLSAYLGAYDGSHQLDVNPDEKDLDNYKQTTTTLPKFSPMPIYRLALGSRLNQHHFALDLGYAPVEKGYYEFAVDYQYQFWKKAWRPAFVFGLDYMQVDVENGGDRAGEKFDASFAGKGFHIGMAYNFYNKYIGWENRLVAKGLSIDNVFIAGNRYRISGLLVSWQPTIESSFVLFY